MGIEYIEGKNATAKIYTSDSEQYAIEIYARMQIKMLCDMDISKGSNIVLMPDVHPGMVGPIGLTMTISDDSPVMPALIGTDIGCGMSCIKFTPKHKLTNSDFEKLDTVIREKCVGSNKIEFNKENRDYLGLEEYINLKAASKNYGTLGGGNHFIEVDTDEDGNYYLIIHSGSRSVGGDTFTYYMSEGRKLLNNEVPYETVYLTGELKDRYLHSVDICKNYAQENRLVMIKAITSEMGWKYDNVIDVMHNYIDNESKIIHKGSISAKKDEDVIIPINMRDGVILGKGKGNPDWNESAPHGSGRIIKRTAIRKHVTLPMFKESMQGIYSTSVCKNTMDESPFAYRSIDMIKDAISDTVEITNILKPLYNYKNGGKEE